MRIKKSIVLNVISIENLKKTIFDQTLVPSIICDKCGCKDKTISKEQ